jgi:hypothetical protein
MAFKEIVYTGDFDLSPQGHQMHPSEKNVTAVENKALSKGF